MDFTSIESAMYGDVENDDELLAELYALEGDERRRAAQTAQRSAPPAPPPPRHQAAPAAAGGRPVLSAKMLDDALADVSSEEFDDSDIDDDALLEEFNNLVDDESDEKEPAPSQAHPPSAAAASGVDSSMLQRLQQLSSEYKIALGKANGNASKIKRFQRALAKIEELTKNVRSGKAIDEDEIPISLGLSTVSQATSSEGSTWSSSTRSAFDPPSRPSPISEDSCVSTPSNELARSTKSETRLSAEPQKPAPGGMLNVDQIKKLLTTRREAYIHNAQLANTTGDKKTAYEYYTVAKQFDEALEAVNSGQVTECEESDLPPPPVPFVQPKKSAIPAAPKTLLEGLQQRMEKYKEVCEDSKKENNDRKLRMNMRILKQYEDAIRTCRARGTVDVSELPCPLGFPPLPTERGPSPGLPRAKPAVQLPNVPGSSGSRPPRPAHQIGPHAPALPTSTGKPQSRQSQQLQFLLGRQLQFKQAALDAKQKNNLAQAKKYLLAAKGFDKLIEASRAGLPVDISGAPIPPQIQTAKQTLKPSIGSGSSEPTDPSMIIEGGQEEMLATFERDLIRQIKRCDESRLVFTKLGDVTRVKLFEEWERNSKRDLLLLRQIAKEGSAPPRFRYESRSIPLLDVCADVNEDHLEVCIVRVLNAKLPSGWQPSDGNIFVRYAFAFPHESHQTGKTKLVAGTNSPDFNEKILFMINRKSKQLLRVIKRNCLKFEVYQKGGFLRSDRLLGSVDYKLVTLEEKAVMHESADLMDGRKPAGGKIEFKVRVREPLGGNRLNVTKERWLVFET